MSKVTKFIERNRQWLWFSGLWLAGIGACLLLSYAIKLLMGI